MEDLKIRTFKFAVMVANFVQSLPSTTINRQYTSQLIRCSSSVGANYRAARRAKSKADYINKLKICEEEADETEYFLELLLEINPAYKSEITMLITEITEILKILVSCIIKARAST